MKRSWGVGDEGKHPPLVCPGYQEPSALVQCNQAPTNIDKSAPCLCAVLHNNINWDGNGDDHNNWEGDDTIDDK
jgi:hypothetical protein